MDDRTLESCKTLIDNRDKVKKVFRMDAGTANLACANIFLMKGKPVDPGELQRNKDLIKSQTGYLNYFRSYGFSCIAALLTVSDDPTATLDRALSVYKLLKQVFISSEYLPFAAMSIAQMASPEDFERISSKTRDIYDVLKSKHWFLTSTDDSGLCALMALSEKPVDTLVDNTELCYQTLKSSFFNKDAVQSLCHVLALCDTDPRSACEKTMDLFVKLKEAGHKYGTAYELPTLGVLAMSDVDYDSIISEMIEIDAWLSEQKGFGIMSTITKKQRLMYAGILAEKTFAETGTLQSAAINSMISLMVAEEIALYSSICATMVATSIASGTTSG